MVSADGLLAGEGYTQMAGGPHAEIMALRDAAAKGHSVVGATAYVTMEPCSHHGRTGPCCDALIAAGIKKVVASTTDPNPLVAGAGFARLRAANIEVEVGPGEAEARELNIGFFSRMIRQKPWVRMKLATSLDGKTALDNGISQWITSQASRDDGHAWRARACAILTGIGTVRKDNPRLDVRSVKTPRQPHLVVVDSELETPLDAQLLSMNRQLLIYSASQDEKRAKALEARGAEIIYLPTQRVGGKSRVDLAAMLADLSKREVNELHVEAGMGLNGSLIEAGLVDEFLVYLAPTLIGQGMGMAQFGPLTDLADSVPLEFKSVNRVGPDLRILGRVRGHDVFSI